MSPHSTADINDTCVPLLDVEMPSKITSCVIGIDVGGTNTDAVVLRDERVIGWHKTPTTSDIQEGVELAIEAVVKKAEIPVNHVGAVKIGTTQFVNAVLEQDSSKLEKVAVIRLCGPYSRGTPPFLDFPPALRALLYGHYGYVDGGYQVDGSLIATIDVNQIKEQARIIKAKSIKSIVVIGIYSPSNPAQEEDVKKILASELGPDYDISCSHAIGRLGFLERENASILNASLRRFARHVIAGFSEAIRHLGTCNLYITLNDGTLSMAQTAAEYPILCFSSGPTNSARGAALLAKSYISDANDGREVLVVDVGGTTTDICALLKSGYPRQSAAFVKIAGVRTNFTIPDVHSLALGGGSLVRTKRLRTSVGPDSVGSRLNQEGIAFGGNKFTATDLVMVNTFTQELIDPEVKKSGLAEIGRALEDAIDLVKTKQGEARVILVGGGSIIVDEHIAGVSEVIRPKYLEVANAVGAAIGRISGSVDKTVVPTHGIDLEIQRATSIAKKKCVAAGGDDKTVEVVEVDVVPLSYATNGATRILVRVVGDLKNKYDFAPDKVIPKAPLRKKRIAKCARAITDSSPAVTKGSSYEVVKQFDVKSYRPRIEGDLWYFSELDLQFLQDGAGILGVGSCGEPYSAYLACLMALRNGEDITIRRQDTLPDDAVVLVAGFMGSPGVYLERIPGVDEITDAMKGTMKMAGIENFDAVVPNEIGGLNAFESILAARRFKKSVLDTDLVARAYPMVWQTVRCLKDVPIAPCSVADGSGRVDSFSTATDNFHAEDLMRTACTDQGSLGGMCISPVSGAEAKTLPRNSFSHAWQIGRSIAISRSLKIDPIPPLLELQSGVLLFIGKIISVTRNVAEGFTRGSVLLEPFSENDSNRIGDEGVEKSLVIDFENENLSAVLKEQGKEEKVLACCPDLIVVLDKANGAPLGISDYKYGLRVSVIALRSPPVWTTERGLEVGGPKAFGLNMDYKSVATSAVAYEEPKSVWEMFGEGS